MTKPPRKILHLDLDAFFCAVEELRDPTLAGKAFAVGGRPNERGVISSCSYPARKMGIHSAMPMAQAVRICPDLIVVPVRHSIYSDISRQVMRCMRDLTPLVEQISIDEAFMDVSDLDSPGEALARQLQQIIQRELRLPCSLGVATNKLVAKIANDVGKASAVAASSRVKNSLAEPPNAITVVPPGQEAAFLAPLPVKTLWGVGPKTEARLSELAIHTIGDLASRQGREMEHLFGKNGAELVMRARGIDERPIVTAHEAKSFSQETTFTKDVSDEQTLIKTLHSLSEGVGRQLRQAGMACQTVRIKIRWPDFTTLTRQVSLDQSTNQDQEIYEAALGLFRKVWQPRRTVRLLGVGASRLGPPARQLSLWDTHTGKDRKLQSALDELRDRFGDDILRRASEIKPGKPNNP